MRIDPALLDPSDPYARPAQTFPVLPRELIDRMLAYGVEEDAPGGTILFARGERSVDFFVVLQGELVALSTDNRGHSSVISRHGPGQFTGELDLFNNREVLVSARAEGEVRLLRVRRNGFRRLLTGEPDIGEIITRALILRRIGLIKHRHGSVTLIGPGRGGDTLRLQRFLTRNSYPFQIVDTDVGPMDADLNARFQLENEALPVVILGGVHVMRNPAISALADALGLTEMLDPSHVYDVVVLGAGPAGLAAAVYAASEGLDTVVLEGQAPGGQAGTSSKIENYLGFPTGISGQALSGRAQVQAQKFGARLAISRYASSVECLHDPFRVRLDDGQSILARSILVATGARYRKLRVENYERFEGQGIHYAATAVEVGLCGGEEVIVVGGGNSAGQAAIYLSRSAAQVHMLLRSGGLAATMSDYLVQRIHSSPKITVHPRTDIVAFAGEKYLREVTWIDKATMTLHARPISNVFVMIGADPNTEWLTGCVALDEKGFVLTGQALGTVGASPYATSRPGVFAVGDVRSRSIKRVASAVGEGSVVVSDIHQHLNPIE